MSHMSPGQSSEPRDWTLRMPKFDVPESLKHLSIKRLTIMGVVAVVAVLAFIIGLLQTSLFAVTSVQVSGTSHLKQSEILALANVKSGGALIAVNDAKVSNQIETNPWVESAHVRSIWPHRITISVVERTPIAQAQTSNKKWALIGTNGVVLQTSDNPTANMPVLMNVTSPSTPGASLDANTSVLTEVAQAMPKSLAPHVKQIQLLNNDLKLGLDTNTIVEMGQPTDLYDKLMAAASVVSHTDVKTLKVLDVTSPHLPVATPVVPVTTPPKAGSTTTTTAKPGTKTTSTTVR